MKKEEPRVWRVWVDTEKRVISFHREGFRCVEFRDHETFLEYVDSFSGREYRYQ